MLIDLNTEQGSILEVIFFQIELISRYMLIKVILIRFLITILSVSLLAYYCVFNVSLQFMLALGAWIPRYAYGRQRA